MGLVHVLENLSNPRDARACDLRRVHRHLLRRRLARTSCYLPVANKLKELSTHEADARTMMIEGILSIQAGDNPRIVEEKLKTFLEPAERKAFDEARRRRRRPARPRRSGGDMARKRDARAHADERWLLTYADMITLLMALFMVLFSIAVVNKGKFDELARSLREAFDGPLDRGGTAVLNVGSNNPVQTSNSELNASQASFTLEGAGEGGEGPGRLARRDGARRGPAGSAGQEPARRPRPPSTRVSRRSASSRRCTRRSTSAAS